MASEYDIRLRERPEAPEIQPGEIRLSRRDRARALARERASHQDALAAALITFDKLSLIEGEALSAFEAEEDEDAKRELGRVVNARREEMRQIVDRIEQLRQLVTATETLAKEYDPNVDLDGEFPGPPGRPPRG